MQGLSFEEFAKKVQEEIKSYLPEKYADSTVDLHEVIKNNDTKLHALTVSSPEGNVAPTIYLEQYYGDYQDGHDFSDVLEEIAQVRINHEVGRDMDVTMLSDYEKVKEKIIPRLVNLEQNKELLADRPYTVMDDLAVTYHVFLGEHEGGTMSAPVTNAMLSMYGVDVNTIHEQAVANLNEVTPSVFKSMGQVMMEMMGDDFPAELMPPDDGLMYVLSNKDKLHGASALLDEKMMQEVSERMNGDFYILPSSVHETIIIPKNAEMDRETLEGMVRDVNATQVALDERLSDHVYVYDSKAREIHRADRDEAKVNVTVKSNSILKKLEEKKEEAAKLNAGRVEKMPDKAKGMAL